MGNARLIYNEERGTWNVFNGAEWYYEDKDYEKAEAVFNSFFWDEEEDDWYDEQ